MAICLDYQAVYYPKRHRAVSLRMQVLLASLLLAVLVTRIWLKIEITEVGYDLAKERKLTLQYDMELRELELQRSLLMRPDTLARVAHERLDLVPLSGSQVTKLRYAP